MHGSVGMVWYEACGWRMVHGGMAGKNLVVGVFVWFGMRLVIVAWYGVMAGKNLVGGWKTVGKREDLCFSCFSLSQILN